MRVESRVFPPFIAKRVDGIFDYDILPYGFLFRRQWGNFSLRFLWIGLLLVKWRRVEHKAARARSFSVRLASSIPCAAVYKLRFTLEKEEKKVHYDTSAMKRFLTSVNLQHEPKASDVITLVKKTFFRTSIVRNFVSRGVKMRISAREVCVKPHLRTRSDIKYIYAREPNRERPPVSGFVFNSTSFYK